MYSIDTPYRFNTPYRLTLLIDSSPPHKRTITPPPPPPRAHFPFPRRTLLVDLAEAWPRGYPARRGRGVPTTPPGVYGITPRKKPNPTDQIAATATATATAMTTMRTAQTEEEVLQALSTARSHKDKDSSNNHHSNSRVRANHSARATQLSPPLVHYFIDNDFDATYGIAKMLKPVPTRDRGCPTDTSPTRSVLVPRGILTTFNSRATLHVQDAMWALLLPSGSQSHRIHRRVSDVLRGYVMQRVMWETGRGVAIRGTAAIIEDEHDFETWDDAFRVGREDDHVSGLSVGDLLEAEVPLYRKVPALVSFLSDWAPSSTGGANGSAVTTVPQLLQALWTDLYEEGFLAWEDVQLVTCWIEDLQTLGYQFPPLVLPLVSALRTTRTSSSASSSSTASSYHHSSNKQSKKTADNVHHNTRMKTQTSPARTSTSTLTSTTTTTATITAKPTSHSSILPVSSFASSSVSSSTSTSSASVRVPAGAPEANVAAHRFKSTLRLLRSNDGSNRGGKLKPTHSPTRFNLRTRHQTQAVVHKPKLRRHSKFVLDGDEVGGNKGRSSNAGGSGEHPGSNIRLEPTHGHGQCDKGILDAGDAATLNVCATRCTMRDGCGYIGFSTTHGAGVCVMYTKLAGCPQSGQALEYHVYRVSLFQPRVHTRATLATSTPPASQWATPIKTR